MAVSRPKCNKQTEFSAGWVVETILLRFVFACSPRVWSAVGPVCWRGSPCLLWSLWEGADGGAGACGVRNWQRPPCGRRRSLRGGGGRTSPGLGGRRGLAPPWPVSSIPRAGGGGVRGGGTVFPCHPPPVPARTPGGYGGVACSPRSWPSLMAGGVAPRIPPSHVLGLGCLAVPGARRGLAGRWWVSLVGGGGWLVGAPPLVRASARGRGVALPWFCLSVPPGRASRQAAPSLPCPPHCTGSRPRAATRMRSAGCPCALAQGCWPAGGTAGVGRRLTWGMRRTAACTVEVAPLSGCRGPLGGGGVSLWRGRGGAGPPSPWPASGCPRAGGR